MKYVACSKIFATGHDAVTLVKYATLLMNLRIVEIIVSVNVWPQIIIVVTIIDHLSFKAFKPQYTIRAKSRGSVQRELTGENRRLETVDMVYAHVGAN